MIAGTFMSGPSLSVLRDQQAQEDAFTLTLVGEGIGLAVLLVLGWWLWPKVKRFVQVLGRVWWR